VKPRDYTDFHEKITDDASLNLYLGYTNTEKVFLLAQVFFFPKRKSVSTMKLQFYIDPGTNLPHVYPHEVTKGVCEGGKNETE